MTTWFNVPFYTHLTKAERRDWRLGLLFVSPWIIGFCAFVLYPVLASFYYGFTYFDIIRAPVWLGLENYSDLFQDLLFRIALYNTAYFMLGAVPTGLTVAYLLALLLNQPLYGRPLLRTVFYLPVVVPAVASAMLWLWILDTQSGLMNSALATLGVSGIPWLAHPKWAKPSLILINLWYTGNAMVIFLAALQDVPRPLYDAAEVDGATWWQKLRHITIPLTTPAILFTLITSLIGASQSFTFPYILTQGGPADATLFYALYLFRVAFGYLRMGYASAMAWMLFLLIVMFTYFIFRGSARWVFYSGE
jgi:multiple sugar transport system permease protein